MRCLSACSGLLILAYIEQYHAICGVHNNNNNWCCIITYRPFCYIRTSNHHLQTEVQLTFANVFKQSMRQQHNTIYSVTHKNYIHCIVYTLCVLAPSNTIDKRQWIIFISFRIYILCAHNISAHALSQNEQGMPMIIDNNMARMHLLFRFLLEIRIYIWSPYAHTHTNAYKNHYSLLQPLVWLGRLVIDCLPVSSFSLFSTLYSMCEVSRTSIL